MSFFGKNLRKIRSLKQLSQKELADKIDLKRAALGAYEEGRSEPKIDTIIRFANHFSISIDALLQRELTVNELLHFDTRLTTDESKLRESFPKIPIILKSSIRDYLQYHQKKGYIINMPYIQLPIQENNNSFRAFEINDLEMSNHDGGLYPGDIIVAESVNVEHFIVEHMALVVYDEIKFRKVSYTEGQLNLQATHPAIEDEIILPQTVKEIWKLVGIFQKYRKLDV